MLDLIISYINFLILSFSYIVKKFTFNPPKPPKYKIVPKETNNEKEENEILFLIKSETTGKKEYTIIKPHHFSIKYDKIESNNEFIPILILTPEDTYKICIIYCQGNSGDLGTSLFECFEISLKCNCIIVSFEYPGYGICKNDEISEFEFHRRVVNVYNYIINVLKCKPNQIFLYGFSLGTGVAFDFACRKEYPVAGLILQSPFLSIIRTLYDTNKTFYFDLFNNCDKAKKLCTKTLFIHGIQDTIIPFIHGKILSKLIPKQYFYDFLPIYNAGHNDLFKKNKKIVCEKISEFIFYCCCNYEENQIINNNEYKNTDNNTANNTDNKQTEKSAINDDYSMKKIASFTDLMNSEYIGFNVSDGLGKDEKEQVFQNKYKANSYMNFSLNAIENEINNNMKTFYNNDKTYNIKINRNFNTKLNGNDQKELKFFNNYYQVNIDNNNKYNLYRDFCEKINEKKVIINNDKTTEYSMTSIISSMNNTNY